MCRTGPTRGTIKAWDMSIKYTPDFREELQRIHKEKNFQLLRDDEKAWELGKGI